MSSPEFETDCAIYDEVGAQVDAQNEKDVKFKENVSYGSSMRACKERDAKSSAKYIPTNSSQKGTAIALAMVTVVLSLCLIVVCITFAWQIAALKSEIDSQNAVSDRLDNYTARTSSQIAPQQKALNAISERLDNISDYVMNTEEASFSRMTSFQQNLNIISELLDNVTANMTNTETSVALLQQNLNIISEQLDNVTAYTTNTETSVTLLQQNLNTVSGNISNVTEQVQQLSLSSNLSYQQIQDDIFALSLALGHHSPSFPASSCAALPLSSPSGYYWVRASNGSSVRVYCDMTRSCGGVTGGWMRVAHLDMTNTSQQCPSGFTQRTDSSIRSCVKSTSGCSSITAPVILSYSRVCGRVIAYQIGSPSAFLNSGSIDSIYVDGVSLTHGSPRQHIWTFAAALDEVETFGPHYGCPCVRGNQDNIIPSFVGNDYFCDTGSHNRYDLSMFYTDPLWDGAGCGLLSTCCNFNTPPWFYRQLPQSTSNDIEIRVCTNSGNSNENIAIEIIDVYVI